MAAHHRHRQLPARFALAIGLGFTGAATAGGLDTATRSRLEQALACVNLSIADLAWDKRPHHDRFRLATVDQALDQPLSLAAQAARAGGDFADDPGDAVAAAAGWLGVAPPARAPIEPVPAEVFADAPSTARPLLAALYEAHRSAQLALERALAALSPGECRLLAERGAKLYTDESEEPWDRASVLLAAARVDIASLLAGAAVLADAAATVRASAVALDTSGWSPRRWSVNGVRIALGGPGAEDHEADIVLDPGGDDRYQGGALIADLDGDDRYRDAAPGLLAMGLLLDLQGDDRHQGGDFTQGGAAFGIALLIDAAGDDRYDAGQCAQGAAFFGFGLLLDLEGRDAYRGNRFVQGFGGANGLGVLSDLSGPDTYLAGGRYPHAPLLPENFQSLSQGFGFGLRGEDSSGGVGILADHGGNDVYSAEVFGQGASYWYALGILVDSAGHDSYNLFQYGQGAGVHLSAGVLLDRQGNDAYSCLNGVAQGSGHDWGVGLLLDLAGNDGYQGSGMSQGGANANAIGLLIDRSGNDSYSGWNVKNQGDSFLARGTLGLGVLLDMAGTDRYTHGGSDGGLWTRGTVGVGLDAEDPPLTAGTSW